MSRLPNSQIHIQLGLRGWAAIATALAIFIAVPVAIAFFAIGLFVFVLPVMLLAPLFYYFTPKQKPTFDSVSALPNEVPNSTTIIDGTFRVTDSNSPKGNSGVNGGL
jgi:hypothetical protein